MSPRAGRPASLCGVGRPWADPCPGKVTDSRSLEVEQRVPGHRKAIPAVAPVRRAWLLLRSPPRPRWWPVAEVPEALLDLGEVEAPPRSRAIPQAAPPQALRIRVHPVRLSQTEIVSHGARRDRTFALAHVLRYPLSRALVQLRRDSEDVPQQLSHRLPSIGGHTKLTDQEHRRDQIPQRPRAAAWGAAPRPEQSASPRSAGEW